MRACWQNTFLARCLLFRDDGPSGSSQSKRQHKKNKLTKKSPLSSRSLSSAANSASQREHFRRVLSPDDMARALIFLILPFLAMAGPDALRGTKDAMACSGDGTPGGRCFFVELS